MIEAHAVPRQPIDVGRLYNRIAIAADAIVEVVYCDHQYIRFAVRLLRYGAEWSCHRHPKQIASRNCHPFVSFNSWANSAFIEFRALRAEGLWNRLFISSGSFRRS